MDPLHKRKLSDMMETDIESPALSSPSKPVSQSPGSLRLSKLGLSDQSMADDGIKIGPTKDIKGTKGKEALREGSNNPDIDSSRTSPDYAPTPTPSSSSPMSDVHPNPPTPDFTIPNLTLNNEGSWETTPGLSPPDFRTVLAAVPSHLLSKVAIDTLTNEYMRLFNALSCTEEDFAEWDFDASRTLPQNKQDYKALLADYAHLLTQVASWRENRDTCRAREIPMDGRFKWDTYVENLTAIEKMCVEAQRGALKAMEKSQRAGRFRQQVVLGKFAQRNGRSVVEEEGMSLGVDDGRGKRVEEEKKARREREEEIRLWEEDGGGVS